MIFNISSMTKHTSIYTTILTLLVLMSHLVYSQSSSKTKPLRVGIAGLSHSHVHWILGRPDRGDVKIVGIAEHNKELAQRYANQYGYSMDMVYGSLEAMLDEVKPDAVLAFNSIYGHLEVVQACAPKGVHVMVEKPLAVSLEHAVKMKELAEKHQIHLLTNYETTWYPTNHKAFEMVGDNAIGKLHKIVVRDGHKGPREIGVNEEFLEWLTDPKLNGGGAIIDFGCYGANLATWLTRGERPESVYASTKQLKPEVYPKVDDEATIVVNYAHTQAIIQASWNWPFSRKDMDLYGNSGYILVDNKSDMRYKTGAKEPQQSLKLDDRQYPFDDPFGYLAAVVKGQIIPGKNDLSSLENNMLVVEILDAAVKSAQSGKVVKLK